MTAPLDALRRYYDGRKPELMGARHRFAVLCPLVEQDGELHLLFEVRAAGLPQAGEVCFPGGHAETGESAADCALRETEEELSIPACEITLLGEMDFLYRRQSLLHPLIGLVSPAGMDAMRPSPDEVAEVFTVPLRFFCSTPPDVYAYDLHPQVGDDFPYDAVGISRNYPWSREHIEVPIWYYEGHVIWGLTARIVRDFISKL